MLVTRTTYSSGEPASAGPPPTTATCFVIVSCCALPTTTTVGSGPVAGLLSPSVSRSGAAVSTKPWLLISVPARTPASTCTWNTMTAVWPTERIPPPGPGSGGVRSDELIGMPATSGETPPSGCPTARPFKVVLFAT